MRLRAFHVLTAHRREFAAISALAAIVLFAAAAQSASAAIPLAGEGLSGAGLSTGGTCYVALGASTGFSVSGTASGPYPGSFSETGTFSGWSSLSGHHLTRLDAAFTITSGTTTITGSFVGGSEYEPGPFCIQGHLAGGVTVNLPVTSTVTIDGQTFQGPGSVRATLYGAAGARDTVSESVPVPSGEISGSVVDNHTSAALGGICVDAYDSAGDVEAQTQTDSSGAYTLNGVGAGSAEVGFSTGCGAGSYVTQYYNDESSWASADPVTVTLGATTTGIDAAMVAGGHITGTVRARGTRTVLADMCVDAYDGGGGVAASAQTDSSGTYTLSALPTGSYRVGFGCGGDNPPYRTQYYNNKATLASATPIPVTEDTTTSGINAAMVGQGQITGTVIARTTRAPLAGICVRAYNRRRGVLASAQTNAGGNYTLSALPARSYRVGFTDCSHHRYLRQYYKDKPSWASADPVAVTAGTTTSRVNAAMRT